MKRFTVLLSTLFLVVAGLAVTASAQDQKPDRPAVVKYYWVPDPFWRSRWYDPFYDDRFYSYDPYLQYRREKFYKQEKVSEEAEELQKERRKARRDGVITAEEREEINEERAEYMKALEELESFHAASRYIDEDMN
ncbi:MAG: hypothetical protein AB7J13_07785 [Pyrinomonadaceae bacterium]